MLALGVLIFFGPWVAAFVRGIAARNASRAILFALLATVLTLGFWPVVKAQPGEGQGYVALACAACVWGTYWLVFRIRRDRADGT